MKYAEIGNIIQWGRHRAIVLYYPDDISMVKALIFYSPQHRAIENYYVVQDTLKEVRENMGEKLI